MMRASPRGHRRRMALATLLLAIGCSSSGSPATEPSTFITDSAGGALVLHGANVSDDAKYQPDRLPWIEESDATRLADDWGFNFVRYLLLWDAIEPEPGVYDKSYLDAVGLRLDWFASRGIHVVLDMHQDVWSASSGFGGDGAPQWATITDGLPNVHFDQWELNNLSPAVVRAVDHFFEYEGDHPELQDHFAAMWAHVAERFRGHPAVLGYEILNEPFSPHWIADPQAWDQGRLQPFYQRVIDAIRGADGEHWIFYEPTAFVVSSGVRQYLGRLNDPRPGEPRLVFFPHAYFPPLDASLDLYERNRSGEKAAYGTPLAIGEFGAASAAADASFFERQLALFDRLQASWAYWSYWPGYQLIDGEHHETAQTGLFVRTYPWRVAGEPLAWSYDPATRVFELEFRDRVGASGATEIYVPARRFFPGGFELTVGDPEGTWSKDWDATREVLRITTAPIGAIHHVRIEPG